MTLGDGFDGLYTVVHLKSHVKSRMADIHVVSRTRHFLFTPLLHEVAAGALKTMRAAVQQTRTRAKNIAAQRHGKTLTTFRCKDRGEVVSFGGAEALSEICGFRLEGTAGRLAGRMAHPARPPNRNDRVGGALE